MLLPCTMSRICKHCAVGRQLISDIWFTSKKAQKTILLLEQISKNFRLHNKIHCFDPKRIKIQSHRKTKPSKIAFKNKMSHEINSSLTKEKEPADSQVIWKRVFLQKTPKPSSYSTPSHKSFFSSYALTFVFKASKLSDMSFMSPIQNKDCWYYKCYTSKKKQSGIIFRTCQFFSR